jgi:hypothetical protein
MKKLSSGFLSPKINANIVFGSRGSQVQILSPRPLQIHNITNEYVTFQGKINNPDYATLCSKKPQNTASESGKIRGKIKTINLSTKAVCLKDRARAAFCFDHYI